MPSDRVRRAALPMYDMPEVRGDLDAVWGHLRGFLGRSGVDGLPATLDRPEDVRRSWQEPDLVLSQACGYPLVGALAVGRRGDVAVVGTFAQRADNHSPAADIDPGWYRSVVVARRDRAAAAERGGDAGLRFAVNDPWSLSGWVSLVAVTVGWGAASPVGRGTGPVRVLANGPPVVWTGSHRASLAALRRGAADVASIDSVTLALLRRHAPREAVGVVTVADGPAVPRLPLITADADLVPVLRRALHDAVAAPALAAARDRLGITAFVPLDRADYGPVSVLARAVVGPSPPWS